MQYFTHIVVLLGQASVSGTVATLSSHGATEGTFQQDHLFTLYLYKGSTTGQT